jgi:hypothetical protein
MPIYNTPPTRIFEVLAHTYNAVASVRGALDALERSLEGDGVVSEHESALHV